MSASISTAAISGTTLNVTGTGAAAGGTVGVFVDGVLAIPRATANGAGEWSLAVPGLASGPHEVRATDIVTAAVSVATQFQSANVTIASPVGDTTEDVTPVVAGVLVNPNGGPVSGITIQVWRRKLGEAGGVLDGSVLTGTDGSFHYEAKTPLPDEKHFFKPIAKGVDVHGAELGITVSKPPEAPTMPNTAVSPFAIDFDSVLVPVTPPLGYEVFSARTTNVAKPLGQWSMDGESLGLAIDPTTGACTVADPAQFGTVGERAIVLTCANSQGSSSCALTVRVVAAGATRYYDSGDGSDANMGDLPSRAKGTLGSVNAVTRRMKRGSVFPEAIVVGDNQTREDYGDPFKPRPVLGSGQSVGISGTSTDHAVLRSLAITGTSSRGINIQVFSNVTIEDVLLFDSPSAGATTNTQAVKLHNSDKSAALSVPDLIQKFNLIFRRNQTINYRGDGLYITKASGILIENNKFDAAYGGGADCVQLAYENNATNISRNAVIRGNVLLQRPESQSDKGSLVCERTQNYLVEYNYLGGKNFAFSAIGDDEVCRSNLMRDGRLNSYSFGYGVGEQHHLYRHHVYDNLVENCARGIGLSAFGDSTVENGGVFGYQRADMEIHDNVISGCTHAFFADRPWSGRFYRNIMMKCTRTITRQGGQVSGNTVANLGAYTTQDVAGNYTNDGTFLCKTPPAIAGSVSPGQTVTVSPAVWHENGAPVTPDEVQVFWRNKGYDIPAAISPSFVVPADAAADFELSCVVLARKGTNWMLAIAEAAWPQTAYFIPRSWAEGAIPWRKRYFKLGDVAA